MRWIKTEDKDQSRTGAGPEGRGGGAMRVVDGGEVQVCSVSSQVFQISKT